MIIKHNKNLAESVLIANQFELTLRIQYLQIMAGTMLTNHCRFNTYKALRSRCLQIIAGTMLTNHCRYNAYKTLLVSPAGLMHTCHNFSLLVQIIGASLQGAIFKNMYRPYGYDAYESLRVNPNKSVLVNRVGAMLTNHADKACGYNTYRTLRVSLAGAMHVNHSGYNTFK